MLQITRKASARWNGGLKDGQGAIRTASGALADHPYGFASRFEQAGGTNPEELLATAHAGCFTMALTLLLGTAGLRAEQLDTQAEVRLEQQAAGGFAIPAVHLVLRARIPGATPEQFAELSASAKANCPLSKVLRADISLDAALI